MEKSNSKIGDIWVSFFSNYVVTIRDTDWVGLVNHYLLPKNNKSIDHTKIEFKGKKEILKHFEFIANGNGTKKKSRNQLEVELEYCNC